MAAQTLSDIREEIQDYGHMTPEYYQKMMHKVPETTIVDREQFILERCKGKRVLNLGCASGELHTALRSVASYIVGVDKVQPCDIVIDLDRIDPPRFGCQIVDEFDIAVCGEILEHLANPGNLLDGLKYYNRPVLITVPNAFSSAGRKWIEKGVEQINPDHVSWYSYWTLKTLVERYGFTVKEWYWYRGQPLIAEGLIFVVE